MFILPNKRADQNKRVWWEDLFINYMNIENMVENFLIYCIQFLKMDLMLRMFFQHSHELAQAIVPEVLLPYRCLEQIHLKADLT